MGALIKNVTSTYIPGDPGQDGSPYVPARPARWGYVSWTECSAAGAPVIKAVKVYPGESLFGNHEYSKLAQQFQGSFPVTCWAGTRSYTGA